MLEMGWSKAVSMGRESGPALNRMSTTVIEVVKKNGGAWCLVVGHLARKAAAPPLQTPADAILLALNRAARGCGVLALTPRLHLVDEVAGTTTTDVVDGGLLAAQTLLLLELLIKAEHGAFLVGAHVASTTTSGGEVPVGGRRSELDTRCWACCCAAVGDLRRLDTSDVASTPTARVKVRLGGRVRFGDVEVDHFV